MNPELGEYLRKKRRTYSTNDPATSRNYHSSRSNTFQVRKVDMSEFSPRIDLSKPFSLSLGKLIDSTSVDSTSIQSPDILERYGLSREILFSFTYDNSIKVQEVLDDPKTPRALIQKVFTLIQGHMAEFMSDKFGNYTIQKLFSRLSQRELSLVFDEVEGDFVNLCYNTFFTRSISKYLEHLKDDRILGIIVDIVSENFWRLSTHMYGNHVVQKLFSLHGTSRAIDPLVENLVKRSFRLCENRYGCTVVQKFIEYSDSRSLIIDDLVMGCTIIMNHEYGNFIMQMMVNYNMGVNRMIKELSKRGIAEMSKGRYRSNIMEKIIQKLSKQDLEKFIDTFIDEVTEEFGSRTFMELLKHDYANYVVQAIIRSSNARQFSIMEGWIEAEKDHIGELPYNNKIAGILRARNSRVVIPTSRKTNILTRRRRKRMEYRR